MSRTNQMVAMQTSSARLRGQSLSLGKMWKRLPRIRSDVSEIAIHSLLVDWKQRGLDREIHHDPGRDRYTFDE